jgi:hypothetical protein
MADRTNTLNEDYGVYLNGYFPSIGDLARAKDNLRNITEQLYRSGKSPNQVFFILAGMGIPKEKASFAAQAYQVPAADQPLTIMKITEKNQNKMNFNLISLKEKLEGLSSNLAELKTERTFSYSAGMAQNSVDSILEALKSRIASHIQKVSEGAEVKGISYKVEEGKLSFEEVNDKSTMLEAAVSISQNLKHFSNINSVVEMVNEMNSFISENAISYSIQRAIVQLSPKQDNKAFESAISILSSLYEKEESYILENFVKETQSISWIVEVRGIVEQVNVLNNKLNSTREAVVENVYSPVILNEDESYTFYLDGRYYRLHENKVEAIENKNGLMHTMVSLMEGFSFNDTSVSTFGKNGKELTIDLASGKVLLEGKELDHTNVEELRRVLLSTNFVQYNEMYKVDELCMFIENVNTIKHLDFVTSLKSRLFEGVKVNIMKFNESVYVNRLNRTMNVNELIESKSAIEVQSLINEYLNYDVSNLLSEMIEGERKSLLDLNQKKEEISEAISFLKEKKSEVEKAISQIGESEELNSALDILESEIVSKEKELQSVFDMISGRVDEKKSPEDLGFIEAVVVKPFDGFSKGDKVFIGAEEYTTGGKSDDVSYSDKSMKKKGSISKNHVEVNI